MPKILSFPEPSLDVDGDYLVRIADGQRAAVARIAPGSLVIDPNSVEQVEHLLRALPISALKRAVALADAD